MSLLIPLSGLVPAFALAVITDAIVAFALISFLLLVCFLSLSLFA